MTEKRLCEHADASLSGSRVLETVAPDGVGVARQ
jgi:hypothetical protein